jgi:hypothetical protein
MIDIAAISGLVGLVFPTVADFVKKKWLRPEQNTPEATLSTLATSKPEIIDKFILAFAELLKAKKEYFNRDVIGIPSTWIINLRSAIRPFFVIFSLFLWLYSLTLALPLDPALKSTMNGCIGSWFGSRLL